MSVKMGAAQNKGIEFYTKWGGDLNLGGGHTKKTELFGSSES